MIDGIDGCEDLVDCVDWLCGYASL